MGDPERLLESSSADPEVRELLQRLRGLGPDASLGSSSWAGMAAKVATLPTIVPAPGNAPLAPPGGALASGVARAGALKLLIAGAASTVLGVGAHWAHSARQQPNATVVAATTTAAPSPTFNAQPLAPPEASSVPPLAVPATGAASAPSAVARISRLDAEASLLAKVRSELRGRNPHAALVALNQLQSAFPHGELNQERDVLTVEVLSANGNTALAKRKAAAFIAAHPSSPHSAKLERFLEAR